LAVLREMYAVQAATEVLSVTAEAFDRQCSRCGADAGWTAIVLDRATHPDHYAQYESKRRQFMTELQNGRVEQALSLQLPAAAKFAPGAVLAIDAWRLQGIGLVLAERPQEAVEAFGQALQSAGQAHPYQATNLLLLLSDARRRSGDVRAAEGHWQAAVQLACDLAHAPLPVIDPIFWERAAYLRPVNSPWPQSMVRQLADYNVRYGIATPPRDPVMLTSTAVPVSDEVPIWTAVGHWRLAREESQAALVALKKAEAMTTDNYVAARLQLAEAKALVRMGQQPAATAMLIHAASQSDPRLARPAAALLGTIKLQQGSVQQGFNLLHRAVEEDPGFFWPERPEAEAALGLACLLMGDENAGLQWLHVAQQGFEASAQQEALIQCLENEAAWLEQAKKKELAATVRKRLESLQTF